jgi:hypothetical protein
MPYLYLFCKFSSPRGFGPGSGDLAVGALPEVAIIQPISHYANTIEA